MSLDSRLKSSVLALARTLMVAAAVVALASHAEAAKKKGAAKSKAKVAAKAPKAKKGPPKMVGRKHVVPLAPPPPPPADAIDVSKGSSTPVEETPIYPYGAASTVIESEPEVALKTSTRILRSQFTLIPTVSVGVSTARVTGSTGEAQGDETQMLSRASLSGGLLAEYGTGKMSFQSGLLYIQEGFVSSITRQHGSYVSSGLVAGRIDYLGIPLLGKLNYHTSPRTYLSIKGGVIPVVFLGMEESVERETAFDDGRIETATYSSLKRDEFRSVNAIGQLGLGYLRRLTRTADFRLEAVYNHSLFPIGADDKVEPRLYTSSFLLSLGLGFGI